MPGLFCFVVVVFFLIWFLFIVVILKFLDLSFEFIDPNDGNYIFILLLSLWIVIILNCFMN